MIDLDRLARHVRTFIDEKCMSVRQAATEIGCGPATLGRLLQGTESPNIPNYQTLQRVAVWMGTTLSVFENEPSHKKFTFAEIEIHLRALPDLAATDAETIMEIIKAFYDCRKKQKAK